MFNSVVSVGADSQTKLSIEKLTVAQLSEAKHLQESFLETFGVRDCPKGVAIEYRREDWALTCRQRIRTAMRSGDGFRWAPGDAEIVPYGIWLLDCARMDGKLIIVEGESDCWTLWSHGFPALGLPGASMAKLIKLEYLSKIPKIYVWREPDKGGDSLIDGISKVVFDLKWPGAALELKSDEFKDPSAMHIAEEKHFKKILRYMMLSAKAIKKYEPSKPKTIKIVHGSINRDKIEMARNIDPRSFLEAKGGMIKCPYHDDTNPSMSIGRGFFNCFVCGKHVDSIDYIRKVNGLSFADAVNYLVGGNYLNHD